MSVLSRRIHAFQMADQCFQLGARLSVTAAITGLLRWELLAVAPEGFTPLTGQMPGILGWMNRPNLLDRIEASMFASTLVAVMDAGAAPAYALITSYRLFSANLVLPSRVGFDRAFCIARSLYGLWGETTISLALVPCAVCRARNLTVVGDTGLTGTGTGCAFCALLERYPRDARVRAQYPSRRALDPVVHPQWSSLTALLFRP